MSWITVIWSMTAAACLTLSVMNLLVWCRTRTAWGSLLFALTGVGVAGMAACELWMMRAATPHGWGVAMRWIHVPAWVVVLALVGFVRVYLRAGRPWLAWAVCGVRTLSLILNFIISPNLNYREITGLRHLPILGETVAVGEGVPNPWMLVGQLSLVLLVVFVADATIAVWRRGQRRQAVLIGGSMVFFVLASTVQIILAMWGVIHLPLTPSLFYLGIVAAMAYELGNDTLRVVQLAKDLAEHQKQMVLAAEAANLGIWIRYLEPKSIWATDKWRDMFGIGKSEVLELNAILQRVHPDDRETVRETLTKSAEAEGGYEQDYRLLLPDGAVRWISSRGRVEFRSDGKPLLVRGVSLDITGRKRAEAEAQRHRNEVTHLSRVAMLGEISGSLAHELNQPLTAILSNAQAAQRFLARPEIDREELAEILHDIVESDRHAGEVIRSLRLLLKKGEIRREPINVNAVILEVLKLMRSDLLNHHISVETDLQQDLPQVPGDHVQLQQVLLNLIMNASDAMAGMDESNRRLRVSTSRTADDSLRVSVRDNGRGIQAEKIDHIFESYYTTKPHGLGLGLAVCRSILRAHHGSLSAENHPEGGAVFHFILPLERQSRQLSSRPMPTP